MDLEKWLNEDSGEVVDVAGLGNVYIRPITAAEMSTCKTKATAGAAMLRVDEETASTLEMCAATVLAVSDKSTLFTAAQLAKVPMGRLSSLIEAVGELNGFGADLDDIAGKLPRMESA